MRLEFECACGEGIAVEGDDYTILNNLFNSHVLGHKTTCKEAHRNYRLREIVDNGEKEKTK